MTETWEIFPEEVWGIILDNVINSKDVSTVLKTFPALDLSTTLQKSKRFWLIGQVMAELTRNNELDQDDILNCRLVCKRWSRQIDYFLENQHELRAYNHELDKQEKDFWNVRAYLNYYVTPTPAYFGGVELCSDNGQENHVIEEIISSRQHLFRNPFVSRSMFVIFTDYIDTTGIRSESTFLHKLLEFLGNYGHHIFYFELRLQTMYRNPNKVPLNDALSWDLGRILSLLPNVRSFNVRSEFFRDNYGALSLITQPVSSSYKLTLSETGFQVPLHLETVKFDNKSDMEPMSHLISCCSGQIRRLEVPITFWISDEKKEATINRNLHFQNLTELKLENSRPDLSEIIGLLDAPNLSKLHLEFAKSHRKIQFKIKENIFPWLRKFSHLKYLNLGIETQGIILFEDLDKQDIGHKFSSLEFLSIWESNALSYNFLLCFPSLRHLQIHLWDRPKPIDCSYSSNSSIQILEELQTGKIYRSNIWELLPKLSTVTLLEENQDDGDIQFYEEFTIGGYRQWDQSRKAQNPNKKIIEQNPAKLRRDILGFLGIDETDTSSDSSSSIEWEEEESEDEVGERVGFGYNLY